jgi:hypothetical protein
MKVPLETTKVRESLSRGGECLLCDLEANAESQLLRYYLGNSVMQPQIRVKVNRSGFCASHFRSLYYEAGNRLGLALITHTHLLETWKQIRELQRGLGRSRKAEGFIGFLKNREMECLICRRLKETVRGYAFATVYLWDKDPEFRRNLLDSAGFCLPHLAVAHEQAGKTLSKKRLQAWHGEIRALQDRILEDIEAKLKRFTTSYDYRSDGSQPEEDKTVLLRAIRKLAGRG